MIELKDWIKQTKFAGKPWLVFGKGPTFSKRSNIAIGDYNTFSLNHAVREQRVDVAHIIDIDVVEPCGETLLTNCDWLIMPRRPHINCFVSDYMELSHWVTCIPVLTEIEKRGKLITYTFSHERSANDSWTIDARYFSSEIALGILGHMGVKTVRSLGIDGGTNYSKAFDDIKKNTLLANGQPSFDLQFAQLEELAERYKIDYKPLVQISDQEDLKRDIESSTAPRHTNRFPEKNSSAATKIQELECDLRDLRRRFAETSELLYFVTKELSVCSERLGWSQDEVKEYRARILELEKEMHNLYKSKTWKIGRVVTKPAEAISKQFARD